MRIICKYSSLSYNVPYFSMEAKDTIHPIFSMPQTSLLAQLRRYTAGEMLPEEKVLLYLALFNSTGLVDWDTPFRYNEHSLLFIDRNMDRMACVVNRINLIKHPEANLPRYRVARANDANTAGAITNMIPIWEDAILTFAAAHRDAAKGMKLLRIEDSLARMVRLQSRDPKRYAAAISKWAVTAADFPSFLVIGTDGKQIPIGEYWERIIYQIASGAPVSKINAGDLMDILDHCELNLPHGTIFAASLMKTLRDGVRRQREFFGAPVSTGSRFFTILPLSPEEEKGREQELALLKQMAEQAPTEPPKREDYKDAFLFLRAQARYRAAQMPASDEDI